MVKRPREFKWLKRWRNYKDRNLSKWLEKVQTAEKDQMRIIMFRRTLVKIMQISMVKSKISNFIYYIDQFQSI